jgi:hypothetical protein
MYQAINPQKNYELGAQCHYDLNSVLKEEGFRFNPEAKPTPWRREMKGEFIPLLLRRLEPYKGAIRIVIEKEF